MLRGKNKLYFYFSIFLFSVILISIANLPSPKDVSKVIIKSELYQPRELVIEIPRNIWVGQPGRIIVEINNEEPGDQNNSSKILIDQESDDEYDFDFSDNEIFQNIEFDLVLTGAIIDPKGVLITPLMNDHNMMFEWKIDPTGDVDIVGSIWIYINSNANKNNQPNKRILIFTKNIQINHDHFLGIRMKTINWIAIIGFVASILSIIRFQKSSGYFGNKNL
ncbi:MAG: hypothetical protein Q7U53_03975 [Anaerolineaceae bacterium]|nr:hypothetical protein [Anaerolineaceae bacterium]